MVLLSLVIFFSADMLDLKDRPTVEQIQIKFVLLLQKYINIRCVVWCVLSLTMVLSQQGTIPESRRLLYLLMHHTCHHCHVHCYHFRHQSEMEVSRQRFAKAMMMVTLCREVEEIQNTANYSNHLDTLEEL